MFDFFGDRGFLAAFALMTAVAFGIGLGWAPARPRLMRHARLGFGLAFWIGLILVGMKWGEMAAGVCFLAGAFFCFLVGMPLGYLLWVPPTAARSNSAAPVAAPDRAGE